MAPKRTRSGRGRGGPSASPSGSASGAEGSPLPAEEGAASQGTPQPEQPAQSAPPRPDPLAEEEEDGEELIGDDMHADYRPMGALDEYEEDGIDHAEYGGIDARARAAAEAELEAREARETTSRLPAALLDEDDEEGESRPRRRRREEPEQGAEAADTVDQIIDDEESGINLEEYSNKTLAEWIRTPAVGEEVKRRFKRFLTQFDRKSASGEGGGSSKYATLVRQMCSANRESLDVSYLDLSREVPILAIWVADAPKEMFELLDTAAMDVVRIMYPDYPDTCPRIHVRVTDLPIQDSIRELRLIHMGCLVKVSGVVTRRSSVFPQLKVCRYNCTNCGYVLGPFSVSGPEPKMSGHVCPSCQAKGPYVLNTEQTVYCNYQKVTLQESPGSVPAGRLPRHKEDLIDTVRPGEEVEVTGVYNTSFDSEMNRKTGFPVFSTSVEANHVQRKDEADRNSLTEDEEREIQRLAKDPQIRQKILRSVAPSIHGHSNIKMAIALSMFGGQCKDVSSKHRIRGDINVLLLGDPGTAKSQFLKYVEKTAPRAIYTTGQGATAVGLTASVHKEPVTREWTLEGGALVLADKGVCLIDEFDKMNDADRTSIHEAMEQQSISISKAGIIATLQARCAVIAAANPLKGTYDPSLSFTENVDLTDPILSRFDCICVVKDTDERLAEFVVGSHRRLHPRAEELGTAGAMQAAAAKDAIDQTLLRKYIMYARQKVRPVLQDIDQGKITQVYTELRREAAGGGLTIAVRHIESIIRMAEASARMHLRNAVNNDDVNLAISVLLRSVIDSQKYALKNAMEAKFKKYMVASTDTNQ
ncbi:hypothetical protein EMIHUDRAFT_62542, partial [Emiliania huxleyi CCMP1516]|uniref:DNA replication licensing factor MCM2 n=2 Tax=Emiliania huxleyi TaxID=2903 RepID=A0A0D3KZE2_EMIH1